jgi:hypothetical protein
MSETDLERVAAQIRKSPASYEYFFDNLDDPAWLRSLAAMKFFRAPPGPERTEDWVRYPGWPESRYLARVAARAPDEVLKLARAIPQTDNPRVHQDLFEIAAQLPGAMAAELARKEAKWLRGYTGHLVGIPSVAVPLLAHLASEGQVKAAFDLASALLAVVPNEGRALSREAASSRLSEYEYAQIVKGAWPALIEADPGRALNFLCDRLRDVMQAGDEQEGDVDLTSFWRHAVENHEQNLGQGLLDTLVDAVRDCSLAVAQTPNGWQLATAVLGQRPGSMFRRIALHLLRVQGPLDEVTAALSDRELAYDINVWHEYGELLRDRFADLAPEQQEDVLATIACGPELDMTDWREERGYTMDDLQRMGRRSRLERYVLVADQLTGEHRETHEALREEFGVPEHPTFLSYTSSWTGPTSPYSQADLAELDPREIIEKLREWTPEAGGQTPSPEGLGRQLQKVIAERPAEFAGIASEFAALDATYVRALLMGLADAVRAAQPLPWRPVVELCGWVLEQTANGEERGTYMERDPHWGWAHKQVASLLSQGFAKGPAEAPQSERDAIWALLTVLAENPDPTPEQEESHNGEGMDPATLAINTTRGEAMHAVVRYMLWVERALGDEAQTAGIEYAPEAKGVLEQHLDLTAEPSLAIRAVYGQWFPQFVRLDEGWARQLAPRVFPAARELAAYFDAAWNTYVVFNRPFTSVFGVLGDAYCRAVQKAGEQEDDAARADSPDEHLADHLLTYRVLGATVGGDEDLFARFWKTAGSALRKQVLTRAGWSLEKSPNLESEIRGRFIATWEWIFGETNASDPGALAGFGAWLGAPTFDASWLLAQARAVLDLGVHLDPDFVVYRALPRLASDHPREAVAVLRGMVLTDNEGWSLHGAVDETREALRLVLASEDADTRREAEELVHLLGARGMTEFRDLVADVLQIDGPEDRS